MNLNPTQAVGILNIAMQMKMIGEGAIPEVDTEKISEAAKIVEIATQQMVIVEQIGEQNVPADNLKALKDVLAIAGNGQPAAPHPDLVAAAGIGTAHNPAPGSEAASWPKDESGAHVPPAEPQAPVGPQTGEFWVDANANAWQITQGGGGPQVEAKSVATGERTVLPSGFLKQRTEAPSAPPAEPVAPTLEVAPESFTPLAPGERRANPQDGSIYVLYQVNDGGSVMVTDASGANYYNVNGADWMVWPVVAETPEPVAPEPALAPPAADPVEPVDLTAGENRNSPTDGNTYVLKNWDVEKVVVTDIFGGHEGAVQRSEWVTWPIVEGAIGLAETPAPEQVKAEQPKHAEQEFTAPLDDDEGDEDYGNLLAQVHADYSPAGMPTPMELSREPAPMPDDLTSVDEITARALHSQFNALSSRARYLHGLEDAKARGCGRIVRLRIKPLMRNARKELGKNASVEEVRMLAEEDDLIEPWIRRRDRHSDRAESYKTFLSIYAEDVAVLSRDHTMRSIEEKGS